MSRRRATERKLVAVIEVLVGLADSKEATKWSSFGTRVDRALEACDDALIHLEQLRSKERLEKREAEKASKGGSLHLLPKRSDT